jgi:hypothetical protein
MLGENPNNGTASPHLRETKLRNMRTDHIELSPEAMIVESCYEEATNAAQSIWVSR